MKRTFLCALLLAATVLPQLAAQDSSALFYGLTLSAELGGGYKTGQYYQSAGTGNGYDLGAFGLTYSSPYVDFGAGFRFTNDGKYTSTEGWMSQVGNQYFLLDQGYTRLHFGGLSFEGGYIPARSTIDTPYEVFLNPESRATLGMALSYEDSFFQYQSRWISVNMSSSNAYPWDTSKNWSDKGVNYRLIAVKFGDLRVGYEESSVYLRTFDANYFLSPLPSILTNTLLTQGSNPWTQQSGVNDNSLMGLFADYKSGPLYAEAQFLIDDINLNFLTTWWDPSLYSPNVDKFAWSIGGRYQFDFGTLGFWHGGATAYTYASTYDGIQYEYMYLPTIVFNGSIVDPRDSNVGFQWGENAIAFRLTYDYTPFAGSPWEFDLSSHLEYVIRGSSSPENPWNIYGDLAQIAYRIELFNVTPNEVLEQYLILHTGVAKNLGDFRFKAVFDIGADLNSPQEYSVSSTQASILTPVLGNNKLLLALELSVRYTLSMATEKPRT